MVKTRKIKEFFVTILIIIYVALQSGSMFQMIYASDLHKMECIVLAMIGIYCLKRGEGLKIKKNMSSFFVLTIFIISVIDIIIWGELAYHILYLANFASIVICFTMAKKIPYEVWIDKFLKVLTFLAIISLLGWMFRDALLSSSWGLDFEGSWGFKSFIFFNIIKEIPERNCGIFWEPGMYQGFLNFGILLLVIKEKHTMLDFVRIVLFGITIFTTYSTTGYIVLMVLMIYMIYKCLVKIRRNVANVFVICAVFIFVVFDGFMLIYEFIIDAFPSLVTDKLVTQNRSFTTRIYSIVFDFLLAIRYPFGVGRTQLSGLVQSLEGLYNVEVSSRTSTISTAFVSFGIVGGCSYLFLWIRGISRKMRGRWIETCLVILIMFLILNSEPMFYHLFFGTIMFYWNQLNNYKEEKPNSV